MPTKERQSKRWLLIGGIALGAIALVMLLWYAFTQVSSGIQRDTYQMVQLTNGEVYFGKLENTSGEYMTLHDAYTQPNPQQETRDITIVRLSATVAKPEDTLYIAREQVVHWSNLQPDSKVLDAINSQQ